MNKMSERIYSVRKEFGWTMKELGDKVGVSKSTINKWEKGHIETIKRPTIEKLAIALKCSPSWLMGFDDEHLPDNVVTLDISKLNEEGRQKVYEYYNLLASNSSFIKK